MSVLKVLVENLEVDPSLRGICAGYEAGQWRSTALSRSLAEHLPQYALTYSELQKFNDRTGVRFLRRAAENFYSTTRYKGRGEFGELLLDLVMTQILGTERAISKIYFKDSANDTVKGFDAVHVVATGELELWLGEVKFYADLGAAIRAVVEEIREHVKRDYLRSEFLAIMNKIDEAWPHADALRRLLDEDTSLDQVFRRIRIPALLTYDSSTVASHTSWDDPYRDRFEAEVTKAHAAFSRTGIAQDVNVHLLLLPLESKRKLVHELNTRLSAWQSL